MNVTNITLKFSDEEDAARFFEQNKHRMRDAGFDRCTLMQWEEDEGVRRNLVCMFVSERPELQTEDRDYLDWAEAEPAPWWKFS